jgi:hypothetical protein
MANLLTGINLQTLCHEQSVPSLNTRDPLRPPVVDNRAALEQHDVAAGCLSAQQ